jgi:hypothetical protein
MTSTDWVEVRLVTEGKTVLDFSAQYVAEFEGVSHNVVRFDSAHEEPNIDILKPDGQKETRHLQGMDKRTALTYALGEIDRRWEFYRTRHEEWLRE